MISILWIVAIVFGVWVLLKMAGGLISLISTLLISALAVKNVLLGILGASLVTATVGAIVVLYCVRWLQAS